MPGTFLHRSKKLFIMNVLLNENVQHFSNPAKDIDAKKAFMPTLLTVAETHDDGSVICKLVDIESLSNPLVGLTYDDFAVSTLLQRGISLHSIKISPDLRLGFDDEINAFNDHLESISSDLFEKK